jgi:Fur family transcriptional regulator, iron response regulator
MKNATQLLERCSLTPTPQRIAVAQSVMNAHEHLSADAVFRRAKRLCPSVSRATVYNTLNLLVEKHVLKAQRLLEETTVFDANTRPHHHFVDEETGEIIDIPWEDLSIRGQENLKSVEVRDFQVVIRGRRRK